MDDNNLKRQLERAEYRAQLIEAELNAVRSSKAYKLSKKAGIIGAHIKSDPVGLSKKAAKMLINHPSKALHIFRSASRGAFITQSVVEQTAKYQEWILLNEPDLEELEEQRELADKLDYQPLISIVTPVFDPPLAVFEDLIESVLEQTYTNFELCLGNFGADPAIKELILKYANIDDRVKHYAFEKNLGIAGNSNQILKKVKGEFIALLDHDDTLSPDALYENAKLLNEKPYDFIYSDKDKIDEKGNRFDPLFKPELSPEMLLNVNYLTHLNIMRTSIVREIGGWDPATDGAQDWDIFLRVLSESKYIGFIPKVLYHWRVIATSTAMSIETKPYALANQCKAVDKYLKKQGVNAHASIERTELFINWDEESLDKKPVIFITYSSVANTRRVMRQVARVVDAPRYVLLVDGGAKKIENIEHILDIPILKATQGSKLSVAADYVQNNSTDATVVFVDDTLHLPKDYNWYARLTGLLTISGVGASSGRIVSRKDLIVNSGGVINSDGVCIPIFLGYPRYYQGYLGNAEWIRNLSILESDICATTQTNISKYRSTSKDGITFDGYFMWLRKSNIRLVMSPHVTAMSDSERVVSKRRKVVDKDNFQDVYGNPNMSKSDPLRLFDDETLRGVDKYEETNRIDSYQHDAIILADTFDISLDEIKLSQSSEPANDEVRSVGWILPGFEAVYAGLVNIFTYVDYLANHKGLKTTIYILSAESNPKTEREAVLKMFPSLKTVEFVAIKPTEISKIGQHDWGIATQWATAYPLARAQTIKKKFYFIQDNEANFYPKGSISALVESSYRFGFTAIAGTQGLLDMYKNQYGGDGFVLKSKVDLEAYRPRKDMYYVPKKTYKVFFYARPGMPRNAFELGIAGLKRLKQQLGDDVEVITAGAPWDSEAYGVGGMFTNLGKIAYEAVPKLYRSVDVGLMFMFSGHPGVTASELMASGCPVVVNEYDDVTWHELYQHEKTCLVTTASASEVARNLLRCLEDQKLRVSLIDGGLERAKSFYANYEASASVAYEQM